MTTIDTNKDAVVETTDAEAHALRAIQVLEDGATCILAGIGYDLGLFETLASLPPVTSDQLADAAGLDERYVREWLGGMVTARFVDHEPATRTYTLNPEYAPFVTGSGPDNLTRSMRYIALMGSVAPKITEKFRTGGGLSYEDYESFNELQASESAAVNDASLVDLIIPLTQRVDDLQQGIRVADIGCGEGRAINLLARAFPASTFVGHDFNDDALVAARAEAAAWGLTNATFERLDVAQLDVTGEFDLVTAFDAIHDQAHPATVLANIRRALRPDGTFLMVDINAQSNLEDNVGVPGATFLYAVSTLHCMSVSLGQGGDGLGTVWGVQTAERMLREAGFGVVDLHVLDEDPINAYFVARP